MVGTGKTGKKAKQPKKAAHMRAKYEPWLEEEGLARIAGWARDGCTDQEIAKNVGVAYSTLRDWRDRFPALSAALKCARDVADRKVEARLFDRTQGYTVKLKKTFKVKKEHYDEQGRKVTQEELQTGIEEVHIPADVTAQIFWLKNRKPNEWRDKRTDADAPAEGVRIVDDIPPQEDEKA